MPASGMVVEGAEIQKNQDMEGNATNGIKGRNASARIHAHGEMAELIAGKNWAETPLGPIESWSETLLTVVNLMLSYPFSYSLYWGPERTMLYNDVYARFLYQKHPAALGSAAKEVWQEAWAQVGPEIEGAYEGVETVRSETRIPIEVNGVIEDRWFTYGLYPVYENGRLAGVANPGTDVTSTVLAQQAEKELRTSRERVRLALDSAALAFWFYDPARNVVGGDERMQRFFGLDVPEGPAELWLNCVFPEDRERVGREFAAAIAGEAYDTEYRISVHGETCWMRAKARLSPEGEDARMLGICEDISQRKHAEAILTAAVERLGLAEQIGNIATWQWDVATGDLAWDAKSTWIYGVPPQTLDHVDKVWPRLHPDDLQRVQEQWSHALLEGAEVSSEFRAVWPDGSVHWLLGKGRGMPDEHGAITQVTGVNIDITERRTAELALLQNEKLAAVGKLASTISHEINNPLEAVTNLLFLVRQDESLSQNAKDFLETADRELARISQVASQTLRFHRQSTAATSVGPDALVEEVLQLYSARLANASIKVRREYAPGLMVTCYEGDIRQVLNNLVGNAIDAMKTGGRLTVRTSHARRWSTGDEGVRITIADRGTGMGPEVLRHVFDAFYTTKGINGTGLGLWISCRITHRHKGYIRGYSSARPERSGSVFTLWLPARFAGTARTGDEP